MPPALLATAYMATSAQKDAVDAQESPPLPGPWTLVTVSVPPAVTTSRAMALPGTRSTTSRPWTYLSQLRLMVHHIQGVKNECADYISRNNFDALIGALSEALAKEAFGRMDVHLDLNMTMIRPLDGLQQSEYLKEFGDIYKRLEKRLEPLLVNQD